MRRTNEKVDVLEESAWDELVASAEQIELLKGILLKVRFVVAPFPWPKDDSYFRNCELG